MNKVKYAIGIVTLLAGMAGAACMGPFCWDDKGASIGGIINDGNGAGLPSMTLTTIGTTAPTAAGQEVRCSNCVNAAVCISSGTGVGAYVDIDSPTVKCDTL